MPSTISDYVGPAGNDFSTRVSERSSRARAYFGQNAQNFSFAQRCRSRLGSSAVRMTNENGRAADPPERSVDCRDVAFESVETVLGRDHFVRLGLKRWDQLAEAGAIGPESVNEYNTWFRCHICFFLLPLVRGIEIQ
jgi:hypothetical protein